MQGHQLGSNAGSCVKVTVWRVRCGGQGVESQVRSDRRGESEELTYKALYGESDVGDQVRYGR